MSACMPGANRGDRRLSTLFAFLHHVAGFWYPPSPSARRTGRRCHHSALRRGDGV